MHNYSLAVSIFCDNNNISVKGIRKALVYKISPQWKNAGTRNSFHMVIINTHT